MGCTMKRIPGFSSLIIIIITITTAAVYSQVPVAVMPATGHDGARETLTREIRQGVAALGGISVIGDNELRQVMELHEKAQALGSDAHDPGKLKVAEYLIKGSLEDGRAQISVISVNTNLELHNTVFQYNGVSKFSVEREIGKIRDAVYIDAYSKERKLPSGTAPYMKVLNEFTESLGMGDAASYHCIAFYSAGAYKHPETGNKKLEGMAKVFLGEIRPRLIRSKLIFAGTQQKENIVSVWIIADKMGSRKKHRFDFMDLPDGSLGIIQYQPDM